MGPTAGSNNLEGEKKVFSFLVIKLQFLRGEVRSTVNTESDRATPHRSLDKLVKRRGRSRWPIPYWDCGFESRRREWTSVVNVVCCQVEVTATGRSLVQRSPTDCAVAECDRDPTRGQSRLGGKKKINAAAASAL